MDRKFIFAWLTLAIVIIALFYTVGWTVGNHEKRKAAITKNLQLPMRTQMYSFGHSEEFKTVDGMPCVVFTNDKGAGLSCDWNHEEVNNER